MADLKKEKLEIRIDNAKVMFRNFSGTPGTYNQAGNRNFCVFLPDDLARDMESKGWNIRWLKSREDEPPQALVAVKVNYGNYPPSIFIVSNGKASKLSEENLKELDTAELEQVDLIIRGYSWEVKGETGIKAYLKEGYFVLATNDLAKKYLQATDSVANSANDYEGLIIN